LKIYSIQLEPKQPFRVVLAYTLHLIFPPPALDPELEEPPANKEVPEDGAYRDRTGDLRLAKLKQSVSAVSGRFGPFARMPVFMRSRGASRSHGREADGRAFALVSLADH
jgi:hypothetical protein